MGRSVSYPRGALVAFTVLDVEDQDDWDFDYEWLRGDLPSSSPLSASAPICSATWTGACVP